APDLMLLEQGADEAHHLPGLLEARKDVLFLIALVIVLDECANDLGGMGDGLGLELLAGIEPMDRLAIDEQQPPKDAVLAHQIFGRRDLVVVDLELGSREARGTDEYQGDTRSRGSPQERATFAICCWQRL